MDYQSECSISESSLVSVVMANCSLVDGAVGYSLFNTGDHGGMAMARAANAIAPDVAATLALYRWGHFGDAGTAAAGDRSCRHGRLLWHPRALDSSPGWINRGGAHDPVRLECNSD